MDKQAVLDFLKTKDPLFTEVSDQIWGFSETRFACPKSADALCEILKQEGFSIERPVAGMADAFVATWGEGAPTLGFLGEYDALPVMSQVAGATKKEALEEGAPGQGCGHHSLGVGALAGALGYKEYLEKSGKKGTVKYFGCPGEESGSGKAFMARDGIFHGVDAFLTWHPFTETRIWGNGTLANFQLYFHFKGKTSHAAAAPHLGRSALDACELMNVGVNYLREHIVPEARVHYAYIDVGGRAPNVVQPTGSLLYFIRAPKSSQVKDIAARVTDIAKGAALMTGTTMEVEWDSACAEYLPNEALCRVAYENMQVLGPLSFTAEEMQEAQRYVDDVEEGTRKAYWQMIKQMCGKEPIDLEALMQKPLLADILPFQMSDTPMPGSTDVGDASWIAPTMQFTLGMYPIATPPHSWQWTSYGKTSVVHKATLRAGEIMALTAIDLLENPAYIEQAKEEWSKRRDGEVYASALPKELMPK